MICLMSKVGRVYVLDMLLELDHDDDARSCRPPSPMITSDLTRLTSWRGTSKPKGPPQGEWPPLIMTTKSSWRKVSTGSAASPSDMWRMSTTMTYDVLKRTSKVATGTNNKVSQGQGVNDFNCCQYLIVV